MNILCENPVALDLRTRLEAIDAAYRSAPAIAGPDQGPLVAESREALRLFVRIGNDELRSAIVDLLRTMVDPQLTSDVPNGRHPSDANKPACVHRP